MVPAKNKIVLFWIVIVFNLPLLVMSQEAERVRVYRVQFAASKTFIQPSYFEKKFSLDDSIKYFEKDGWYKYYIGDFKSRAEAEEYYHETGDAGYVISFLADSPEYLAQDTGQAEAVQDSPDIGAPEKDTVSADIIKDSIDNVYGRKIALADSAFKAGDLELAKKLYRESAELKPGLAYPMLQVDKIINMEAEELESGKDGISGLEIFLIGLGVFIIAVVLGRIFGRKKKPGGEIAEEKEEEEIPSAAGEGHLIGDEFFVFLDKPGKDLSSWDQLKILEEIRDKKIELPEFSYWLNSENLSVLGFCLRMIRSFKQRSAFHDVLGLLSHSNDEIRAEAVVTLGELGNKDALKALREKFESENFTNRMLILRAMARIPDDSSIEFLKELLKTSGNIQIEAAHALASIKSVGAKGVHEALEDLGQDSDRIARHILINKL
jgi:hypothetical protein